MDHDEIQYMMVLVKSGTTTKVSWEWEKRYCLKECMQLGDGKGSCTFTNAKSKDVYNIIISV